MQETGPKKNKSASAVILIVIMSVALLVPGAVFYAVFARRSSFGPFYFGLPLLVIAVIAFVLIRHTRAQDRAGRGPLVL